MSIENRLTALQNKLEELVNIAKRREEEEDYKKCENDDFYTYPNVFSELRSLELWKNVVAECLGSLSYVFFICGASIPWTGHFPPFLSIAFTTALIYGALTGPVFPKAQLNPAFSIALTALGQMSTVRCFLFIVAQCGGAIAGSAILYAFTVPGYQGSLGATSIAPHIDPLQAFGLELVLTFILTLTYLSDQKSSIPTAAVLLAASLVAIPCTGGGLNPVRSLGPSFVMNKWPKHWVFWFGPILGALVATYFTKYIFKRGGKGNSKDHLHCHVPSDEESIIDLAPAELPTTTPDRLNRFEPIYGGTRSLYMKPSPVLPRSNLNRSQSVYASKRFERLDSYGPNPKFSETAQSTKKLNSPKIPSDVTSNSNYDTFYERTKTGLLLSGPPSYDSSYYKNYEKAMSSSSGHAHSTHNYNRENRNESKNESMTTHGHHGPNCTRGTNRILASYDEKKYMGQGVKEFPGELDAKLGDKIREERYFETSEMIRKNILEPIEKKMSEESSGSSQASTMTNSSESGNGRYNRSSDQQMMNRRNSVKKDQIEPSMPLPARKPYEMLEGTNSTKKLLEYSPNSNQETHNLLTHSHNNSHNHNSHNLNNPHFPHFHQNQSSLGSSSSHGKYSPKLFMNEKDSTYSRILEPLRNSKNPNPPPPPPPHSQILRHQGMCSHMSPNERVTYSYH